MKTLVKYTVIFCVAFGLAGALGYTGVSIFTRSAPEVILPDLVGKNILQVLETLTRMGLNPKLHTTQYHGTIPKYGVTFQDPRPGSTIKKGRDVVIYISKGFKESRVPDLRQVILKQGLLTLEANELRPNRILYVYSDQAPKQGIISQYPLPFSAVAANTGCDLLVSKGPRPITMVMPDLEKLALDRAAARIEALGLSLEKIQSEFDPNRPEGFVLKQEPAFGTQVLMGARIRLVVNHGRAIGETDTMDPNALKTPTWVTYTLPPGFSNRHVRVIMDIFGKETDAFNGFMKPGKNINLLIPGGIKTKIRIFVDYRLKTIRDIDPWRQSTRHFWGESTTDYFTENPFTGEPIWQ